MEYDAILRRLQQIEQDLGERQAAFEQAAGDVHRLVRDFELRVAQVKATAKGSTETAKKDAALIAIAASDDKLYEHLKDAEARYESLKAAIKVLEGRAMIGMALLKSHTRESGPQPSWSQRTATAA